MAQTVIVVAGTAPTDSTTLVVAAGVITTFVIYASTGSVLPDMAADILYDTPGGDVSIGYLSNSSPVVQVQGPAQVFIRKYLSATAAGVLQET